MDSKIKTLRAPEAKILIVDDTPMSINQIKGLLRPTQIQTYTASNGYEALAQATADRYDLILIDYLMPDINGIETLKRIKNMSESKNHDTCCVAVSANTDKQTILLWQEVGFDGWLEKPVRADALYDVLKSSISANLISEAGSPDSSGLVTSTDKDHSFIESIKSIENVDVTKAFENCGSVDNLREVLKSFTLTGPDSAQKITFSMEQGDFMNYTILVHALKGSARLVGDDTLSKKAATLEDAGAKKDLEFIRTNTTPVVEEYKQLITAFKAVIEKDSRVNESASAGLPPISPERLQSAYDAILELVTADDFDSARNIAAALSHYTLPSEEEKKFETLRLLLTKVDRTGIRNLLR